MGKNIFCALIIAGLCFGDGEKVKQNSKFAIGITGGLNYAIYLGDDWSKKTVSAPRINVGINSRFKLTSCLSNVCELSYLRLFYKTKDNYGDTSSAYEDHITFDNIYISSDIKIAAPRKGFLSSNIGIGLAGIWPFTGTWDNEFLSFKNANNCRSLFLTGTIDLELDKYPIDNGILKLAFRGHYCIVSTPFPYVAHPSVLTLGVAIAESIPLRCTLSLLLKI